MAFPRALRPVVLAALSITGGACAVVPQAAIEIGPAQAAAAAPPEEEGTEPAKKAAVSGPGCSWTSGWLQARDEKLPLCFAADGACFATLEAYFTGPVKVSLPEGKPMETGARLELSDLGTRLSVTVAGDALVLYPQQPIVFGSMLVAEEGAGLFVERVFGDSLELSFRGDWNLHLRGAPFSARAGCMDVGLVRAGWSEEAALSAAGIVAPSRRALLLSADRPVALSVSPGGAAVAEITESQLGPHDVELLEQRGPWSRIVTWLLGGGALFGWVDSSLLGPAPPPVPLGVIGLLGLPNGVVQPLVPGTVCPRDVVLFAEVAGTRAAVGVLETGMPFVVGRPTTTEHTEVHLRSHNLDLLPDSKWLVWTAALEGCKAE